MATKKIESFKVGQKVKITKAGQQSSGYTAGTVGTVSSINGGYTNVILDGIGTIGFNKGGIEGFAATKEALLEEKKEYESKISDINDKLQWIEETGNEEYDEEEVRIYKAIKVLDEASTPVEKAKAIAKIIRG